MPPWIVYRDTHTHICFSVLNKSAVDDQLHQEYSTDNLRAPSGVWQEDIARVLNQAAKNVKA